MNIELRDENEVILGKGDLGSETVSAINPGDILKLEDDRCDVKGTFILVRKMFKITDGIRCCPNVVFYVQHMEDAP